jgi:hypothetical protein
MGDFHSIENQPLFKTVYIYEGFIEVAKMLPVCMLLWETHALQLLTFCTWNIMSLDVL